MSDLRDHESELAGALRRLEPHTSFADVLTESAEGEGCRLDSKSVSPAREPTLRGAVLRAWGGGRWVEAATSGLDAASLRAAADSVLAGLTKAGSGAPLAGEPSTVRKDWTESPAHPLRDVPLEELIALEKDVLSRATAVDGIKECQVSILWADDERFYLNTAGARCYQVTSRVRATTVPIAIENGRVEFDYLSEGGVGGRERLAFLSSDRIEGVARDSAKLLHAGAPPTGEMSVLLDPGTTGTFAHESFGHGTEADQFVRNRSYLLPILGTMVGPETLTIADEGPYPGAWGMVQCDDEGNPGRRTVLVERGRFLGGLHDRETAAALHASVTGNARRADFLSRLFVRMTNTYVEPGDWSLEELVREVKQGVLMEHSTSGIEDPQGGQMQLKVKKGRKIENGRLTDTVTSMALSGKVLDFLKGIRGLSRRSDFEMTPGYCGKGHTDLLPVASGGTYLLSTAIVGPA